MKNRFNLTLILTIIIVVTVLSGCLKLDSGNNKLTVNTYEARNITDSMATLNGSLSSYFLPQNTFVNFEYGTSTSYGQTAIAIQLSSNPDAFIANLTGLTPSTTYHFRLIAGSTPGGDVTFTTAEKGSNGVIFNTSLTYGSVSDYSGNSYKTIEIGTQTWMAENLKTPKLNDGTDIPFVTDGTAWLSSSDPAYSWYENDNIINKTIYGGLYNWYTVNTGKLCPEGWHVPTDAEWTILTTFLGGTNSAGTKLAETGTIHRLMNATSTNESGFTALPGGSLTSNGIFYNIGWEGKWWSSTDTDSETAYDRETLHFNGVAMTRNLSSKLSGYSVRCIKGLPSR